MIDVNPHTTSLFYDIIDALERDHPSHDIDATAVLDVARAHTAGRPAPTLTLTHRLAIGYIQSIVPADFLSEPNQ